MLSLPFLPKAVFHMDRSGAILAGYGGVPEIFHLSPSGDTISEILLRIVASPVSQDEVAEWEDSQSVRRFREMGGRIELERIPRTKPFFDDVFVDDVGQIWLSRPTEPSGTPFLLLDTLGRFLGEAIATGIRKDPRILPIAKNGNLYVVGRDEYDVQRLYRFRITERY